MKIQNNVSFCGGGITYGRSVEGMGHLFTKGVTRAVANAPDGTELYVARIADTNTGRIGFSTPASGGIDIAGEIAPIASLTERSVLNVINEGVTRMGNGVTKSWLIG